MIDTADGYFLAYDLKTGREVWRTRNLDYPWDEPGWGSYSVTSAYGQMFWVAQTGIYAIDWETGAINWKYEKDAPPFETPYTGTNGQTVYPFQAAALIADGKIFAYSSKHTPETPFYRGQPTVCIDVFTGKEVWSIGMTGAGEFARSATQLAIADGYMTLGSRDGVMYTFGIGLSETTVSAPQLPLTLGQKVFLTGTVLDLSPAQPGTPCVSKESMAAQMEYIHMQTQIGGVRGDVAMVGVPVYLYAIDPNGNDVEIGLVTSDGYSGTFGYAWEPKIAGEYIITATFMGDESYDMSSATTYLTVAEGPSTTTDNTTLYAIIGATVAIIVVMIVCFILFRKK
jgi:outer membrane protein assembly factor BamB